MTPKKKKLTTAATTLLAAVALAVGPTLPAAAAQEISGGEIDCQPPVHSVLVRSTGVGHNNHEAGGVVVGSYNNGSTPTTRTSYTNYSSVAFWRAFATGIGSNISSAYGGCYR